MSNELALRRIPSDESKSTPNNPGLGLVLCIGMLLGLCILGLMHNVESLGTDEVFSVEAGAGIESEEDFEANVNAAPLQKKIGFLGLAVIGIYCFLTVPKGVRVGSASVILACSAFLFWVSVSTFWSADRTQTVRELIRIVVYVFSAVSIVMRFPARDVIKIMIVCMIVSVLTVYIGEIAAGTFRPWASDFRLHGTIHSSALAHHALVMALGAAALAINSPKKLSWQILLAFALITIVFSKTRGGFAATIIGLIVIQSLRFKPQTNLLIGVTFILFISSVIIAAGLGGPQVWKRLGNTIALGRSEGVSTLTGRLPLWEVIWNDSHDTQIFGAGYGAFWTTKRTYSLSGFLEWFPRHSHNAYLETIVDLGFVGLILLIAIIITSFTVAIRSYLTTQNAVFAFVAGFVAAGIIDGFVEVIFVSIRELGLFIGLAICLLMIRHPVDISAAAVSNQKPARQFAKNRDPRSLPSLPQID